MLLKDLPEKLQDFAILRMVECDIRNKYSTTIEERHVIDVLFVFDETPEGHEWMAINSHNNLEPMYTKYPELR